MLNLNDREWKCFYTDSLFDLVQISSSNDLGKIKHGVIPCIGRKSVNNGFQGEYAIDSEKINKGNCITISMVGESHAFYQGFHFGCSQNILLLYSCKINKYNALFLCTLLNQQLKKYNYGYPVGKDRFLKQICVLPVDTQENPDYDFMEQFIKEREAKFIKNINYLLIKIKRIKSL